MISLLLFKFNSETVINSRNINNNTASAISVPRNNNPVKISNHKELIANVKPAVRIDTGTLKPIISHEKKSNNNITNYNKTREEYQTKEYVGDHQKSILPDPDLKIDLPSLAVTDIPVPVIERNFIPNNSPSGTNDQDYLSISDFALKELNSKVLGKDNSLSVPSAWDLVESGIKGINKLTGSNMKLEKSVSDEGLLKSIEFKSRLLSFSTPIRKSEQ